MQSQSPIKGRSFDVHHSFCNLLSHVMEPVVIDFEFLRARQNEMVVKEASVAGENISDSFRFEPPYYMAPLGSIENELNWNDGRITYHKLSAVLKDAIVGFAHVYSYGSAKCNFLSALLERTVLDLDDFKCPPAKKLKFRYSCALPCHRHPHFSCATKSAHSLYAWLMYQLQTKSYVTYPPDMSRHTFQFISVIGIYSHSDWSIDIR